MLKIKRAILLFLMIPLLLSSCSSPPEIPKTHHIISALCEYEINLPAGRIYSSDFDITDKNYLSDRLLASYFNEPNIEKYKKDWISYSFFVSDKSHACEFAAIYCATPESLADTSRMLACRLDSIKKLYGDEFSSYIQQAKVVNLKNCVLLIISNDAKTAFKAVKKVCL